MSPLSLACGFTCGAGLLLVRKQNQAKLAREARERSEKEQQERQKRELRLKEEEERRAEYQREQEKRRAEKEFAEKLAGPKQEVLSKFDSLAREGRVGKSEFKEVLVTFLKEVMKWVPLEQGLRVVVEAAGAQSRLPRSMMTAEFMDLVVPLLDGLRDDVLHLPDYDKIAVLFFDLVDSNRDGSVERQELEAALDEATSLELGPKLGSFLFRLVDKNGNGKIDLGEAQRLLSAVLEFSDFAAKFLFDVATGLADSPSLEQHLAQGVPSEVGRSMVEAQGSMVEAQVDMYVEQSKAGQQMPPPPFLHHLRHMTAPVKSIYEAAQAVGGGTLTGVLLSGREWLQGGIDLETFTGILAPTIEKGILLKPEKSAIEALISESKAVPGVKEMATASIGSHWVMIEKALTSAQVEASKAVPELCQALFQLLDVDGDGRISQREITLLKSFASGFGSVFANYVVLLIKESGEALTEAERLEVQALCPDGFKDGVCDVDWKTFATGVSKMMLGIFDLADKNGDKVMKKEELAALGIKILRVGIQILRCLWKGFLAAALAVEEDALRKIWEKSGIDEVDESSLPQVLITLPRLLQAAVLR